MASYWGALTANIFVSSDEDEQQDPPVPASNRSSWRFLDEQLDCSSDEEAAPAVPQPHLASQMSCDPPAANVSCTTLAIHFGTAIQALRNVPGDRRGISLGASGRQWSLANNC